MWAGVPVPAREELGWVAVPVPAPATEVREWVPAVPAPATARATDPVPVLAVVLASVPAAVEWDLDPAGADSLLATDPMRSVVGRPEKKPTAPALFCE